MSNKSKSIAKYVIGIYILIFILLYLIPLWVGNFYGRNFRYEFILAIIVGLPLSYLILQEKAAKNLFRRAGKNFEFEVNRKKEHENHIESQKAVFRFIHQEHIRSDMGKSVENYFHKDEYNTAKKELENAKEKLSNIELFIALLKVVALWVGAFYFFQSIKENQIGKIENKIERKVDQAQYKVMQDSMKLIYVELKKFENQISILDGLLEEKTDTREVILLQESLKSNKQVIWRNQQELKSIGEIMDQVEIRVNLLDLTTAKLLYSNKVTTDHK